MREVDQCLDLFTYEYVVLKKLRVSTARNRTV